MAILTVVPELFSQILLQSLSSWNLFLDALYTTCISYYEARKVHENVRNVIREVEDVVIVTA